MIHVIRTLVGTLIVLFTVTVIVEVWLRVRGWFK
jgi:hypothetical protein